MDRLSKLESMVSHHRSAIQESRAECGNDIVAVEEVEWNPYTCNSIREDSEIGCAASRKQCEEVAIVESGCSRRRRRRRHPHQFWTHPIDLGSFCKSCTDYS